MKLNLGMNDFDKIYFDYDDEKLDIIFPNIEALVNFLKSNEAIILDDKQEEKRLNKNINKIKEDIKKAELVIYNYTLLKEIDPILSNMSIIYDLTNLSIKDELNFLTNFKPQDKFLFIDKYNLLKEKTLEELTLAYTKLNETAKLFKSFNLSPCEYTYLLYDLIRKRKPIEGEKENSRDLVNVLFNEEIVCMGYTNIFNSLLELLDIKTESLEWVPKDKDNLVGHVDSLVYINDSKYDVHSLMAFDLAWDSLKKDDDEYKCYYSFLPIIMDKLKKERNNLELNKGTLYYLLHERFARIKKLKELNAPLVIIEQDYKNMKQVLEEIYYYLGLALPQNLNLNDLKTLENLIYNLDFNRLNIHKFKQIITKAKEIEKILLPDTIFNDDVIKSLVSSTFSHKYERQIKKEERLIRILGLDKPKKKRSLNIDKS